MYLFIPLAHDSEDPIGYAVTTSGVSVSVIWNSDWGLNSRAGFGAPDESVVNLKVLLEPAKLIRLYHAALCIL